jgi:hypothetical protein
MQEEEIGSGANKHGVPGIPHIVVTTVAQTDVMLDQNANEGRE